MIEAVGRPIAVSSTGRCRCGSRVVYLRGQHKIPAYNLISTNGKASGIHLKLTPEYKPERHVCESR